MRRVRVGRRARPRRLAGDRAYGRPNVRRWLWRYGVKPVIPRQRDQLGFPGRPARFDRRAYRRRNAIERCVGWLKGNRRLGTRHDKLAAAFMAWVTLAMIQRCFRVLRL
jgi:transposase